MQHGAVHRSALERSHVGDHRRYYELRVLKCCIRWQAGGWFSDSWKLSFLSLSANREPKKATAVRLILLPTPGR